MINADSAQTFRTGLLTYEDVWDFMENPLLDGLYFETWYDGEPITSDNNLGFVFYNSKMLGVPRLTQIRVKDKSCKIPRQFEKYLNKCSNTYDTGSISREPFGKAVTSNLVVNDITYSAWLYTDSDTEAGTQYGSVSSYDPNGYVINLAKTKDESKLILDDLKKNKWIDRDTRLIVIDFILYNGNINLFSQIQLMVEFPGTGGAFTSWSFHTVKLLRYVNSFDYFIMGCEILFAIYILYYTVEEVLDLKYHKFNYLKDYYNVNDVIILLLSYVTIAFSFYRMWKINDLLDKLLLNTNDFQNFSKVTFWEETCIQLNSVVLFFATIKIFKFVGLNSTLNQLHITLSRCAGDIAGFLVIFFIMFTAFATLGYLIFGDSVKDYRTFSNTLFTLFRIILGDFDIMSLRAKYPVSGTIYFGLFVMLDMFILLNMFVAIVNASYTQVKFDLSKLEPEFMLSDYLRLNYSKVVDKLTLKKDRLFDMQSIIEKKLNGKDYVDKDLWRKELMAKGYAYEEIEAIFSKYDLDNDGRLNAHEKFRLMQDLIKERYKLREEFQDFKQAHQQKGIDDIKERAEKRKKENEKENGSAKKSNASGSDENDEDDEKLREMTRDEFYLTSNRLDRAEAKFAIILSKIDKIFKIIENTEAQKLTKKYCL